MLDHSSLDGMLDLFENSEVQALINDDLYQSLPQDYESHDSDEVVWALWKPRVENKELDTPLVTELKEVIAAAKHNGKPLVVADFPKHCESIPRPSNQLNYVVRVDEEEWTTTYFFATGVDPRTVLSRFYSLRDSHPHLVAKLVFALYSQNFEFVCSAKGAIAFLHEHIDLHRVIQRMIFKYTFASYEVKYDNCPDPVLISPTDFSDFRRFSNIPIHQMSGLRYYKLVVQAKFWETTPWERGVDQIIHKVDLLQRYKYAQRRSRYVNFLDHFARLVPAVQGPLRIEGIDSAAKRRFVHELAEVVATNRRGRNDVVRVRECLCDRLGRDKVMVEHCCMYDLPVEERKWGIPPPAKKRNQEDEEDKPELPESQRLRDENEYPPDSIALQFLGGPSFQRFARGREDREYRMWY